MQSLPFTFLSARYAFPYIDCLQRSDNACSIPTTEKVNYILIIIIHYEGFIDLCHVDKCHVDSNALRYSNGTIMDCACLIKFPSVDRQMHGDNYTHSSAHRFSRLILLLHATKVTMYNRMVIFPSSFVVY